MNVLIWDNQTKGSAAFIALVGSWGNLGSTFHGLLEYLLKTLVL